MFTESCQVITNVSKHDLLNDSGKIFYTGDGVLVVQATVSFIWMQPVWRQLKIILRCKIVSCGPHILSVCVDDQAVVK